MSTQWDAANPTEENGVTQQMIDDAERRLWELGYHPQPVTIEEIEAEMQAVLEGRAEISYNLASAGTGDQLRNYLDLLQDGRRRMPHRFGAAPEGGGFAALSVGISATVPNCAGPILAFAANYYVHKQQKLVSTGLSNICRFKRLTQCSIDPCSCTAAEGVCLKKGKLLQC